MIVSALDYTYMPSFSIRSRKITTEMTYYLENFKLLFYLHFFKNWGQLGLYNKNLNWSGNILLSPSWNLPATWSFNSCFAARYFLINIHWFNNNFLFVLGVFQTRVPGISFIDNTLVNYIIFCLSLPAFPDFFSNIQDNLTEKFLFVRVVRT